MDTNTLCSSPLDEGSVRRRSLYLHDTQYSQKTIWIEPIIPANEPSRHMRYTAWPPGWAYEYIMHMCIYTHNRDI